MFPAVCCLPMGFSKTVTGNTRLPDMTSCYLSGSAAKIPAALSVPTRFPVTIETANSPPVCNLPADTVIHMTYIQEVVIPLSLSDPDNNLASCTIVSGPGSLSNNTWRYTPTDDETVLVTIQCTDLCGETCSDDMRITFKLEKREVQFVYPANGDTLFGGNKLWAWGGSDIDVYDCVIFQINHGYGFTELGRDYEGTAGFRDGLTPSTGGYGFEYDWTVYLPQEGLYPLKTVACDTLGACNSDSIVIYLEPTPPVPKINAPSNGEDFCNYFDLLMSNNDENLSFIEVYYKLASNVLHLRSAKPQPVIAGRQ